MLGFSSISEAPLSQASTKVIALGYLPTVNGLSVSGTLYHEALANIISPSASVTGVANVLGDVDAQASISVVPALATTSISSFFGVYGQARVTPSSSVATFSTGSLDYNALAHTTPTGAASTGSVQVEYDAQATTAPSGVHSVIVANDFFDVVAQAKVTPSSVSAFLTIYIGNFSDVDAQATVFVPPAVSTGNVTLIDFDAKSNITTGSVSASNNVSPVDADGQATVTFDSTFATLFRNLDTPTSIRFPYQDFADEFSRDRTLYLVSYDTNATVHITEEDHTVYIDKPQGNNTVYIAA